METGERKRERDVAGTLIQDDYNLLRILCDSCKTIARNRLTENGRFSLSVLCLVRWSLMCSHERCESGKERYWGCCLSVIQMHFYLQVSWWTVFLLLRRAELSQPKEEEDPAILYQKEALSNSAVTSTVISMTWRTTVIIHKCKKKRQSMLWFIDTCRKII